MTFPTSIGVGTFSSLVASAETFTAPYPTTKAAWEALFADAADIKEFQNIREMPQIGAQPNIVRVPQFGVKTSLSVGAQSDAPDLNLTINAVPQLWAPGQFLYDAYLSGTVLPMRFSLCYAKPDGLISAAAGIGSVDNASVYFAGRIESVLMQASLSDAATYTVAISLHSDFSDWYTIN